MGNKQSLVLLAGMLFFWGCDRGLTKPVKIECARYEDAILDEVRESVPRNCLPPHSTDIYVDYNPGGLLGGARTFVRCGDCLFLLAHFLWVGGMNNRSNGDYDFVVVNKLI